MSGSPLEWVIESLNEAQMTVPDAGGYSVSNLDDMLVHLVTEGLAYQSPALV